MFRHAPGGRMQLTVAPGTWTITVPEYIKKVTINFHRIIVLLLNSLSIGYYHAKKKHSHMVQDTDLSKHFYNKN